MFIFLQFAFGVSAGFCVITSYYVGMHDERGVRRSLATQLLLSAALTVALTALALVLQGLTEYNFGNGAVMKSFWLVQGCLLVLSQNWKKESPEQDA